MSVIGYISLRYNKGWIEKLQVRSTRKIINIKGKMNYNIKIHFTFFIIKK